MFSYYGSKTQLVKLYPSPKEDEIIEWFAGAAKYSLEHFEKQVTLIDKYPIVVAIWKWLQQCSEKDILGLPRHIKFGTKISDLNLDCKEAEWFLGFMCGSGPERPRLSPPKRKAVDRPNHLNFGLKRVAAQLYKIKHWNIIEADYRDIPIRKATHFVDPPYQFGGHSYVMSNRQIDFNALRDWSQSLIGQVIICENTKATWLDFKPLVQQRGSKFTTTETIWTNEKTQYDNIQMKLL